MNLTMAQVYDTENNLLPKSGGWVSITGNRFAPRGHRLPNFGPPYDIKHCDVVWACKEEVAFELPLGFYYHRYNQEDWNRESIDVQNSRIDEALNLRNLTSDQLTLLTVLTPWGEVKFFNGELAPFSTDLINECVTDGALEIIRFEGDNPLWDEATRDIVGSYQLDGLTFGEAQAECLSLGLMSSRDLKVPHYFYRPIGWFKKAFVEE